MLVSHRFPNIKTQNVLETRIEREDDVFGHHCSASLQILIYVMLDIQKEKCVDVRI